MNIGKIVVILVLISFFLNIFTGINADYTDASIKNKTPDQFNEINYETDLCTCTLLNGKYAVMNQMTSEPKTEYDYYSDPTPSSSYLNSKSPSKGYN